QTGFLLLDMLINDEAGTMMRFPQFILAIFAIYIGAYGQGQQVKPQLSVRQYARAEEFLPWNVTKLVENLRVVPHWITGSNDFWYQSDTAGRKQFIFVNPAKNLKEPAFDPSKIADALSKATGRHYSEESLAFDNILFTNNERSIEFVADD